MGGPGPLKERVPVRLVAWHRDPFSRRWLRAAGFLNCRFGGLVDFYSTVTDLARLRGLSMSRPRANAVW